jgi:hypothetical protein
VASSELDAKECRDVRVNELERGFLFPRKPSLSINIYVQALHITTFFPSPLS